MKAKIIICLLFFTVLFNINYAKAAIYTWLNAAGGGWDTPLNWGTGTLNLQHGVPGVNDTAVLPDLLIAYTITLNSNTNCSNIIVTSLLSFGVSINTNGKPLTVSGDLSVGSSTILSASLFTILGSGLVTLNQVDVGQPLSFVGVLNFGSPFDSTTNVTIAGSNISLYGPIILVGLPSSINNYGALSITSPNVNFYYFGQLNNFGTGTVTTNTTNYNLAYFGATVNNYGIFNISSALASNTNISLSGNTNFLNNYGTFNAGIYPAAAAITLSGTTVGVNNASTTVGTTTYNGAFNLGSTSVIYPSSATATVANGANDVFTIMSDANGSGTIGRVLSGATLSGLYNVQRFMTGGTLPYRCYRLLSSPVNLTSATASAAGLNYVALNTLNSTYVVNGVTYYGAFTGGSGTGFSVYNLNPTIYFYKEALPTSNTTFTSGKNQGVKSILTSQVTLVDNNSYSIPAGNGYLLYYIGSTHNRLNGSPTMLPDNATITNVGYINQQTIPVNLWYTPTKGALKLSDASTTTYPGYNMVGNPYPSSLDLKLLYNDNKDPVTGISANFYVLYNVNQQYVSYNAINSMTSGTGASQYVASGQGFFVVANSNTSALSFKETYKPATPTNPSPIILSVKNLALNSTPADKKIATGTNDATTTLLSGLHMKLALDSVSYDECGIYYNSKWSDNFDNNDALVLGGASTKANISSLTADGYHVGINALGSYTNGKKVRVSVKAASDGNYNIQMEDIFNIDTANYTVSLIDNLKNDSVKLVPTKNYAFTITNADTTTWGDNRFVLSIEKKALPPYQLASFTGQKTTDGVLLNWKTVNEGTYTAFEVQKQGAGDGQYNAIYNVMGDGSGSYNYTDKNTVIGNNTYRLAQTDIHKNVTYSNPVTIVYNPTVAAGALSVYPNPAVAQITVNFNAATNNSAIAGPETYTASIYNINGAVVIQKSLSSNTWSPNVSDLRPGTYIVEIKSGNGSLIGNSKFTKHQ